jgi:hypothetical protein
MLLGTVGLGSLTAYSYSDAQRSGQTQRAVSQQGTVVSGSERRIDGKGGTYYRTTYSVRLDGSRTTTVHVYGRYDRTLLGSVALVNVDPKDSSYAEFPGEPMVSGDGLSPGLELTIGGLLAAAGLLLVAARQRRLATDRQS